MELALEKEGDYKTMCFKSGRKGQDFFILGFILGRSLPRGESRHYAAGY
jgi:hypothetical protein